MKTLNQCDLDTGSHTTREDGICATEGMAWIEGLKYEVCSACKGRGFNGSPCETCNGWGIIQIAVDHESEHVAGPPCVSPVLRSIAMRFNSEKVSSDSTVIQLISYVLKP